jgi:hypothetical protein
VAQNSTTVGKDANDGPDLMSETNSEIYRLVFRGEVLDGQHAAVVRKRLGQALKLEGQKLEMLFSGRPVVIKRDADTPTAARFQALFREAGARLRVMPVGEPGEAQPQGASATPSGAPSAAAEPAVPEPAEASAVDADSATEAGAGGLSVAEAGLLLRPEERRSADPVTVSTDHLSVAPAGTELGEQQPVPELSLDLSHLSIAEAGADIGSGGREVAPVLDVDAVDFDVAPAGSDLGQQRKPEPPPPPDTSHLSYSQD